MNFHHTIPIEFLGQVNVYFGMGLKIVMALILGGLIGLDREAKMKTAGIKTNILICLGATLFTATAFLGTGVYADTDPNRITAQIVSGIGFLGAGAIFHGRGHITGLTTAATIWVVAAIGVTIGSGFPFTAALFTVTVLIVLSVISPLYGLLGRHKDFHLEILVTGEIREGAKTILHRENLSIKEMYEDVLDPVLNMRILHFVVRCNPKTMADVSSRLLSIDSIRRIHYYEFDGDLKIKKNESIPF